MYHNIMQQSINVSNCIPSSPISFLDSFPLRSYRQINLQLTLARLLVTYQPFMPLVWRPFLPIRMLYCMLTKLLFMNLTKTLVSWHKHLILLISVLLSLHAKRGDKSCNFKGSCNCYSCREDGLQSCHHDHHSCSMLLIVCIKLETASKTIYSFQILLPYR